MRFPNAFKGLRRLYVAEILQLIDTAVLLLFHAITALISDTSSREVSLFIGFLLLAALATTFVIPFFAILIQLSGLKKAGKDEEMFRRAHYVAIFQLLTILAGGLLSFTGLDESMIADATGSVSWVIRAYTIWYVCAGIESLMRQCGEISLARHRKIVAIVTSVAITLCFWSDLVPAFFRGQDMNGFDTFTKLGSSLFLVIAEVMYLSYIRKAKLVLKNETE